HAGIVSENENARRVPGASSSTREVACESRGLLLALLRAVLVAVLEHHVELLLRVELADEILPRLLRGLLELGDHRDRGLRDRDALARHRRLRILVRLADDLAQL